jgi:hypothetical protein
LKKKLFLLFFALVIVSVATSKTKAEEGLETRKHLRADEGDKWKPKGFDTVLENNQDNLRSLSDDDASDEGPLNRILC